MRELGFSRNWGNKLNADAWTTFRFKRKDKDWQAGETVRIVMSPRSKKRQVLCVATIMTKEARYASEISDSEAIIDGFDNREEMERALLNMHGLDRCDNEPLYKYTLKRTKEMI